MHLLLPGRHHLLTNYQLESLTLLLQGPSATQSIESLLWAITSANHSGTRRNPLPGHRREVAIEEFATQLDIPSFVYHIDDVGESDRFADYIVKKITLDSQTRFSPTPENTLVATSTPELAHQFQLLRFSVVRIDGDSSDSEPASLPPWKLLDHLVALGLAGHDWRRAPLFLTRVHRASRRLLLKYDYDRSILDLFRHPIGTEDGDLTDTRDYNVYVRAFDEGAKRKYDLVKDLVRPGRIVDIGCCTGSLLAELTRDDRLRESDFYGIELARPLYAECLHRKAQGSFGSDHVFFYQANVSEKALFSPTSVDTFTTFSLTHELESYQGRETLLRFMTLLAEQLTLGGRWINVDVVGPDNPDDLVYLWLNSADGTDTNPLADFAPDDRAGLKHHLSQLSTRGRFIRFAHDFRHSEGYRLAYTFEQIDGHTYAALRLADACEFLSKKDYLDNWRSEMHETFCFWSFSQWCAAVEQLGFRIASGSRAFTNPWIVQHRFENKVQLFRHADNHLQPLPYPATNMVLVAEKR